MLRYAGLDVHKRVVEACVLDDRGQIVLRERFPLTAEGLVRFARAHLGPEAQAAVEATTNTWAVARLLEPHVAAVVVSNPLATKAIAQAKVKTDQVDAHVLAQLLRCGFLPRVWQPDARTQEIRTLSSRRAALVGQRTAVKNRLHALLAERLLTPPAQELFSARGLAWLGAVALDEPGQHLRDSDLRLLRSLEAEVAALDQLLARKGYADARVKLLLTLPGVDVTCAQALLAALGDISRFRDGAHAASYLGLVPCTRQSGSHCYHGPITKAGNGHARWVLIQAAQHVSKHPGPLGVFCRRLAQKKNRNVAVVAAARKLVVIAWHLLTRQEPYRYAQPQPTQNKLARLRIKATGAKRRTGTRGSKRSPTYGTGVQTRTIKPLGQVYQEEGLPALPHPPAGERRALEASHTNAFAASLHESHKVPRRAQPKPAANSAERPQAAMTN